MNKIKFPGLGLLAAECIPSEWAALVQRQDNGDIRVLT